MEIWSNKVGRSLIVKWSCSILNRIKQNNKSYYYYSSISTSSSSAPLPQQSPPSSSGEDEDDSIKLTDNCVRRIKELQASENGAQMLRLSVEAGGCSGFQYAFSLDDKSAPNDRIFEKDGVKLVVDNISYDFVKGANVDYVEELIRSAFQVTVNPSAVGGCSCKSSFMVKQ